MLQNLKTDLALATEFITLRKTMIPMEAREEELKVALRAFGPNIYSVLDQGTVRVSEPGVARQTGTKLVLDETKISALAPGVFADLVEIGFLRWDPVMSRATASKVEAKFDG